MVNASLVASYAKRVAISLQDKVSRRFHRSGGRYSVSDRVTIDGVPADRRSESFVVRSGCDDTCTLEDMADCVAERTAPA